MKAYNCRIYELNDRCFYLLGQNEVKPFSDIIGKELTVLMDPFSDFNHTNINFPKDQYYDRVINYLRNSNNPGIILSSENLDRLLIETMRGCPKQSRIFMQTGNEIHDGFFYYQDQGMDINDNELLKLIRKINPSKINIGGQFLSSTEQELKDLNLDQFPFEYTADNGCFVDSLYLMLRDKYPTIIDKDLVRRD
jgi:hypothetical protein